MHLVEPISEKIRARLHVDLCKNNISLFRVAFPISLHTWRLLFADIIAEKLREDLIEL